jgi:dephospho-CoA kinase
MPQSGFCIFFVPLSVPLPVSFLVSFLVSFPTPHCFESFLNRFVMLTTAIPQCEDFQRFKGAHQRLIGITGGIGSGKTTVAAMIRSAGYIVMSSDDIARELMASSAAIHRSITQAFPHVTAADGTIDRPALARTVFGDSDEQTAALTQLNAIVHPFVFQELARRVGEYFKAGERFVFNETALLFETGLHRCYDLALVVDAPENIRVERLTEHRGLDADDAKRRISVQMPDHEKRSAADYVIENHGSFDDLLIEVRTMLNALADGTLVAARRAEL